MSNPGTLPQKISDSSSELSRYTTDQLKLIQKTIFPDGTPDEVKLFGIVCTRSGLDPFTRQIYAMKDKRGKVAFITGIDGFRAIASRQDSYAGQEGPFWCGADGQWTDAWITDEKPAACKVTIVRSMHNQLIKTSSVAHWSEYGSEQFMWKKMPSLMLAKCAEALALRKSFPNDLSGLYTNDEMDQAKEASGVSPAAIAPQSAADVVSRVVDQGEAEATQEPQSDPEPTETYDEEPVIDVEADEPEPAGKEIKYHKDDFMNMLAGKGFKTDKIRIKMVQTYSDQIVGNSDMRSMSQADRKKVYDFLNNSDPDDILPF